MRALSGFLVAAGAIELTILESFYVPLRIGRWPLPISLLAAVAGNVLMARLMYRATGVRGLSLVPGAAWLLIVLVLAAPRGEEVIVPGTWEGLAFLFTGSIAAAFGAAGVLLPRPAGLSPPGQPSGPNRG